MSLLDSKSKTDVCSEQLSLKLRQVLLLAGILLLLHGGSHTPAADPKASDTAQTTDTVSNPDWQIEVALESMIHAFASLTSLDVEEADKIVRLAEAEARQYGIDPFRILAFIVAESWGNPRARSWAGARGLMQIMPATGRVIAREREEEWGGIKSLYNMEINISYGVWYYHHLLKVFQDNEMAAIAAYNWGPQHIKWRMKKGRQLPEVYPGKVLRAQERLEKEFDNEISTRYWQSFIENNPNPRTGRGHSRRRVGKPTPNVSYPPREGLLMCCRGEVRPLP